jgi:hypothetical protein
MRATAGRKTAWSRDNELTEFFRDLGVLTERVRVCTEGIALMAPTRSIAHGSMCAGAGAGLRIGSRLV